MSNACTALICRNCYAISRCDYLQVALKSMIICFPHFGDYIFRVMRKLQVIR